LTKQISNILYSSVISFLLTIMFTLPLSIPDATRRKFNYYLRKATIPDITKG